MTANEGTCEWSGGPAAVHVDGITESMAFLNSLKKKNPDLISGFCLKPYLGLVLECNKIDFFPQTFLKGHSIVS